MTTRPGPPCSRTTPTSSTTAVPRSLKEFTHDALGHERFTSFDRVSPDGLEVVGKFHSEQWGDFRTFFRFHIGARGKIQRLDVGQAE